MPIHNYQWPPTSLQYDPDRIRWIQNNVRRVHFKFIIISRFSLDELEMVDWYADHNIGARVADHGDYVTVTWYSDNIPGYDYPGRHTILRNEEAKC